MNLTELIDHYKKSQNRINQYNDKWFIFKTSKLSIWEAFHTTAWYEALINKDYAKAKQAFSDCAKADIYYFDLFDKKCLPDLFSYAANNVLITALSDNQNAITEYAQIDYTTIDGYRRQIKFSELVMKGQGHIYCDIIIKAMNKDMNGVANDIDIIKNKCLKKKKYEWLKLDLRFFEALMNENKDEAFDVINILATKEHKKRNKHSWFFKDLVSQPALGYAKIAWINNLELEFNNKYIVNELLPVKPNDTYADNIQLMINNMTLESNDEHYNGHRLSKKEYNERYVKQNKLKQWLSKIYKLGSG